MATTIPAVDTEVNIASALFIDLQLGDTNYYISDAYNSFTVNSNDYTSLGSLLSVSDFTTDFSTTQGTISIAISGIPNTIDYMQAVQATKIQGGNVVVRRKFFDADTLLPVANAEYVRYTGIISNYHIEEDTNIIEGNSTNTIVFECASIYSILANRKTGQQTNGSSRRRFYTGDISFDNVRFNTKLPEFD